MNRTYKACLLALCLVLLTGCGAKQVEPPAQAQEPAAEQPEVPAQEADILPDALPLDLMFASGAGGWSTDLTLERDGSFAGIYHDSEMGSTGPEYPNGTYYISTFSGRFGDIRQVDDTTWSLTLQELTTEQEPDTEWIEDQILYVASTPYGLDGGTDFALYLPDTPVEALSEELRYWWPGWMYEVNGQEPETLQCYGLCDLEAETGFFSWE